MARRRKTDMSDRTENKSLRLRDTKLRELGNVPMVEWADAFLRVVTLLGASIAAGVVSGSLLSGLGVFCALCYIGQKIDQAAH
jgi:hypothetical protein